MWQRWCWKGTRDRGGNVWKVHKSQGERIPAAQSLFISGMSTACPTKQLSAECLQPQGCLVTLGIGSSVHRKTFIWICLHLKQQGPPRGNTHQCLWNSWFLKSISAIFMTLLQLLESHWIYGVCVLSDWSVVLMNSSMFFFSSPV